MRTHSGAGTGGASYKPKCDERFGLAWAITGIITAEHEQQRAIELLGALSRTGRRQLVQQGYTLLSDKNHALPRQPFRVAERGGLRSESGLARRRGYVTERSNLRIAKQAAPARHSDFEPPSRSRAPARAPQARPMPAASSATPWARRA